uniref:Uncharacterized protein n=1 Tax=Coprothermobacter proteolyticus (strain ATCC 35245 / DSM 5265 / OCM 4 / BT) TaxID=309798 RepID=B5Y6T2_COPPD
MVPEYGEAHCQIDYVFSHHSPVRISVDFSAFEIQDRRWNNYLGKPPHNLANVVDDEGKKYE